MADLLALTADLPTVSRGASSSSTTASPLDGLTQHLVDVNREFAGAGGHPGMVDPHGPDHRAH